MFLSLSNTLTMIYLMIAILYVLYGMFSFNQKNFAQNKYFIVVICLSLALWSFSYGVSMSVGSRSNALIWYQLGSFGYYCLYIFVIHYLLHLSNHPFYPSKLIQKIILYAPILLSVFIYTAPRNSEMLPYEMVKTNWGWAPMLKNNTLSLFMYTYFIVFLVAAGYIIVWWYLHSDLKLSKIRPGRISVVIIGTIILGFLYDVLFGEIGSSTDLKPEAGPLMAIIPIIVLQMGLEERGLLDFYSENGKVVILKSEMKELLIRNLAKAFMVCGCVSFMIEYFLGGKNLIAAVLLGLFIGLYGLLLRYIQTGQQPTHMKDNMTCATVSLFIPFVMYYTLIKGTGTAWPVPFIFILLFMLYNNNRMIIGVSVASFMTIMSIGIIETNNSIAIDWVDHFLRLFLLAVFIVIALIVNRFYLVKLRNNLSQMEDQEIVSTITSLLVKANIHDYHKKFDQVLSLAGQHFGVDEMHYCVIDQSHAKWSYKRGWSAYGNNLDSVRDERYNYKIDSWYSKEIEDKGYANVCKPDDLPEGVFDKVLIARKQHLKSLLMLPMYQGNEVTGLIMVGNRYCIDCWKEELLNALTIIVNILSDAEARYIAEEQLYDMAYRDYLTGLPNRPAFYNTLRRKLEREIPEGEAYIIGLLDLDGFKNINDTYGHDVGDQVLVAVGNRIKNAMRHTDMVSRFGGDEFLLFFHHVEAFEDVANIGETMMEIFSNPLTIGKERLIVTASLGLTMAKGEVKDVNTIILGADAAMYMAKNKGKNQFAVNRSTIIAEYEEGSQTERIASQ